MKTNTINYLTLILGGVAIGAIVKGAMLGRGDSLDVLIILMNLYILKSTFSRLNGSK